MPKLNKSLINKLEADIGRGLSDSELRKKHGIPEIRKRVSIRAWKDKSGKIIGTVERTTTPPPNLKAAKRWLSYRAPERWSEHKKPGISSIGAIVPNPGPMTEEEWLQKYGNKQTNPTQPKEAEKQLEQKEKDEAE